MTLTRRQKEIWDFLTDFSREKGYAPTLEEIAVHFGLSSLATVHKHLSNLETKGFIARKWNLSRAIEILRQANPIEAIELPLLGKVAAGLPIEAVETNEKLSIPVDLVRRPDQAFTLRVRGQSMVEEGILDGDFVIVEPRNSAGNGDTVVALVDGDATVKKFYSEGVDLVRLQPANSSMAPIVVQAEKVQIRGIVVAVLRKYGNQVA